MVKKHIMAAMLAAILTMGGYGCMEAEKNSGYSEYRDVNDGALEYMEQRYGEKFTYVRSHGSFMSYTDRGIMVSCESLPGKEIYVSISKKDGEERYYDNYMEYYFARQVEDYIVGVAKNYFDDVSFEVSFSAVPIDPAIDLTTTFEEYILNRRSAISGHMDINDSSEEIGESSEEIVREFLEELKELGVHFAFGINILSTKTGYITRYFRDSEDIYIRRREL